MRRATAQAVGRWRLSRSKRPHRARGVRGRDGQVKHDKRGEGARPPLAYTFGEYVASAVMWTRTDVRRAGMRCWLAARPSRLEMSAAGSGASARSRLARHRVRNPVRLAQGRVVRRRVRSVRTPTWLSGRSIRSLFKRRPEKRRTVVVTRAGFRGREAGEEHEAAAVAERARLRERLLKVARGSDRITGVGAAAGIVDLNVPTDGSSKRYAYAGRAAGGGGYLRRPIVLSAADHVGADQDCALRRGAIRETRRYRSRAQGSLVVPLTLTSVKWPSGVAVSTPRPER
jgi:hypothetical protein